MEWHLSLLHSFLTASGTQRVPDPAATGQYDDSLWTLSLITFCLRWVQLMLSFSHYKRKKNVLCPLECRKPDGCTKLIIYLDTNIQYKKKMNRKGKVYWVYWFQMRWISKGGRSGPSLKHGKMASLNCPSPLRRYTYFGAEVGLVWSYDP